MQRETHPKRCVAPAAMAAVASLCQLLVWSAAVPQSMGKYLMFLGSVPPGLDAQLYAHEILHRRRVSMRARSHTDQRAYLLPKCWTALTSL